MTAYELLEELKLWLSGADANQYALSVISELSSVDRYISTIADPYARPIEGSFLILLRREIQINSRIKMALRQAETILDDIRTREFFMSINSLESTIANLSFNSGIDNL